MIFAKTLNFSGNFFKEMISFYAHSLANFPPFPDFEKITVCFKNFLKKFLYILQKPYFSRQICYTLDMKNFQNQSRTILRIRAIGK